MRSRLLVPATQQRLAIFILDLIARLLGGHDLVGIELAFERRTCRGG
jgi:hypothetical protein